MKNRITILLLVVFFLGFFYLTKTSVFSQDQTSPPVQSNIVSYSQACLNVSFYEQQKLLAKCAAASGCSKGAKARARAKGESDSCDGGNSGDCEINYPPSGGSAGFLMKGSGFPTNTKIIPVMCYVLGADANPLGDMKCGPLDYPNHKNLGLGEPGVHFSGYLKNGDVLTIESAGGKTIDQANLSGLDTPIQDPAGGWYFVSKDGTLTIAAQGTGFAGHDRYTIYGYYADTPDLLPTQSPTTNQVIANNGGQQQGETTFVNPTQAVAINSSKKVCAGMLWDPLGRVFDAKSLEPIPGITVKVFDQNNQPVTYIKNPVTTIADGVFNFLVKEGSYFLQPLNLPQYYSFTDKPNLNAGYSKIYFKDIGGGSSIYVPGQEIKEIIDTPDEVRRGAPDPEERDIPLDPGSNSPYVGEITSIPGQSFIISSGSYTTFYGKASHPFPIVSLVRSDNQLVVASQEFNNIKENRYGYWEMALDNSQIPQDTPLRIILKKNPIYFPYAQRIDINNNAKSQATSSPETEFEPILRYISGYAKDGQGNIIPNATVNVFLTMNNSIYIQGRADAQGYFEIPSYKLPLFNYYLQYVNPVSNSVISKTTSGFVQDNKSYLSDNNIDLMTIKNDNKSIKDSSSLDVNQFQKIDNSITNSEAKKPAENVSNNNRFKILLLIIVIVVLVVTTSVLFYLLVIKRRQAD